jgi:hypothetical protein
MSHSFMSVCLHLLVQLPVEEGVSLACTKGSSLADTRAKILDDRLREELLGD